ncbi:MAG: sodium:proton antiporter [Bacteroidaceae bacterium]|nr:sodium:proton antiporter [Bacteroidaceae bacterium]
MLLTTIIIVAIVLVGCLMMSSVQISNINRAAVAMFCGVSAWVVYMLHGSDFLALMGYPDYNLIGQEKDFIAQHVIVKYWGEACQVILFLIATNTIVEIMNNNGVFDSLTRWLRTRHSRRFLWALSAITFLISANVDNLTTVVLMMSIMGQVVASHRQRVVYSCVILISAILGGSFTVIGDMTSLMLWVHGVVTPSAYAGGLILPVLASLVVFNLLVSRLLVGNVEVSSILGRYDGDDSLLRPWQKVMLLVLGLAGLWSIPTFHTVTKLPPFLGALCVLALIWLVESMFNFKRSGNMLFIQHKYIRNTEFIGMRIILYFLGVSLAVGAVVECGALSYVGEQLTTHIHNVYAYGAIIGVISSLVDNIPFVMAGLNLFEQELTDTASDFVQNGTYWQLLSFCSALGGSLFFVGTLAGHAVAELERISLAWYFRNIFWRVLLAWAVGMGVFYITH